MASSTETPLSAWAAFFQGELGAAAALVGQPLRLLGDATGVYLLPAGILLSFRGAGASAWVLLIEINRWISEFERVK